MRRRIRAAFALAVVLAVLAAPTVNAHNAGCIQTGTGDWVFVGSNKDAPIVPEQNPNTVWEGGVFRLDLQPENAGGDQYGARFAADQGTSSVERPSPSRCSPDGPRAGF